MYNICNKIIECVNLFSPLYTYVFDVELQHFLSISSFFDFFHRMSGFDILISILDRFFIFRDKS